MGKEFKSFLMQRTVDDNSLKYFSGHVSEDKGADGRSFVVAFNELGAEEMFSVGQPIYDTENNLMGYLGIGMWSNLNFDTSRDDFHGEQIPVWHWEICKPTKHCKFGKEIQTYWQRWAKEKIKKKR